MKTTTKIIKSIARIPIVDAIIEKYFKGMRDKFTQKVNKETARGFPQAVVIKLPLPVPG